MIIIYGEGASDVMGDFITLNGNPGAVEFTDSNDDLDITFENIDTAREWLSTISNRLDVLEESETA